MRGILNDFYVGIPQMIPVPRPRQPREEEMKCGSQPADIRMIHRREYHPRVVLLIPCYAHNLAHTLHPFVTQRETVSSLLTEKAISELFLVLNGASLARANSRVIHQFDRDALPFGAAPPSSLPRCAR